MSTAKAPARSNTRPKLKDYRFCLPYNTRWNDNDVYGHMNNAVYTFYIDSICNYYLQKHCGISPKSNKTPIGLVINSYLTYAAPLEYPEPILAAIRVNKLGSSSVTYGVALFKADRVETNGHFVAEQPTRSSSSTLTVNVDREAEAAAFGEFTHVFVQPDTRKKMNMTDELRSALQRISVADDNARSKL